MHVSRSKVNANHGLFAGVASTASAKFDAAEGEMSVSWCDKLASQASVGLRVTPRFRPADDLLKAVSSLFTSQIKPLENGERPTFIVDRKENFEIIFTLSQGYKYSISATVLSVSYVHRVELRNASAGLPWLNFLSEQVGFTQSLEDICSRVLDCIEMLDDPSQRITQFGLRSHTLVGIDEMPPGIVEMIESTLSFWGNAPFFSFQIVSILDETEQHTDRCLHTIARPEDDEIIPTISLEWQRTFKDSKIPFRRGNAKDLIQKCTENALLYFETLGEGGSIDA
jgi:hypothetical protein